MILARILQTKKDEIAEAMALHPLPRLMQEAQTAEAPRGFLRTLQKPAGMQVIAEVKRASPSKGLIRADFDPVAIAQAYESAGAACLSVLTDQAYFQGSLDYLRAIRKSVSLPLLRKDFIIDEYHVWQSRAAGADAILLIVAAFYGECAQNRTPALMNRLAILAKDLGMDVLTEVHTAAELKIAIESSAELIGINNRDLKSFHTTLDVTYRLAPLVPPDRWLVSESGIHHHEELQRLEEVGVKAVLVGESLMRQSDIAAALRTLLGRRGVSD